MYGQGMCEEYGNHTHSFLPVEGPDPFVALSPATVFCHEGGGISDWVGVINFVIFILFLIRWKRLPQVAAQVQDMTDYTPADFAVFIQGIKTTRHNHDAGTSIWDQLKVRWS